jgi:hypothetical protein
VITSKALRIYENAQKASSVYGKPLLVVPVSAINSVQRLFIPEILSNERLLRPERHNIKIEEMDL